MSFKKLIQTITTYLKQDTWHSWLVSMILIVIAIKFIFFPILSFINHAQLPLVVVESCSMYHGSSFNEWWQQKSLWYEGHNITKDQFAKFSLKNGLNKGDIIFVWGRSTYQKGNIIIFTAETKYPIIHRIINEKPFATKGDHNLDQLPLERNIPNTTIIGKAIGRVPLLGWVKLIFFEPFKPQEARGRCTA